VKKTPVPKPEPESASNETVVPKTPPATGKK